MQWDARLSRHIGGDGRWRHIGTGIPLASRPSQQVGVGTDSEGTGQIETLGVRAPFEHVGSSESDRHQETARAIELPRAMLFEKAATAGDDGAVQYFAAEALKHWARSEFTAQERTLGDASEDEIEPGALWPESGVADSLDSALHRGARQEGEDTQRLQLGAHDGEQGDTAGPSDDRIETFGCVKWFPTSAGQRSMQSVGRVAAKPAYLAED